MKPDGQHHIWCETCGRYRSVPYSDANNSESNPMRTASDLAKRFGGNPNTITAEIGNPNGWGWADAVLAAQLPDEYDENPYEYRAYDLIRDTWGSACDAVERGDIGANNTLQALLSRYRAAMEGGHKHTGT